MEHPPETLSCRARAAPRISHGHPATRRDRWLSRLPTALLTYLKRDYLKRFYNPSEFRLMAHYPTLHEIILE